MFCNKYLLLITMPVQVKYILKEYLKESQSYVSSVMKNTIFYSINNKAGQTCYTLVFCIGKKCKLQTIKGEKAAGGLLHCLVMCCNVFLQARLGTDG